MERMPVFVKIDEYEDVLNLMKVIRRKLADAKQTLARVNELKNEEDHQLDTWQATLEEVEKKVDFIDTSLTEPENY